MGMRDNNGFDAAFWTDLREISHSYTCWSKVESADEVDGPIIEKGDHVPE